MVSQIFLLAQRNSLKKQEKEQVCVVQICLFKEKRMNEVPVRQ